MTEAFLHLMRNSHVLSYRSADPAALARGLNGASSGEAKMIRAALSLLPAWLLSEHDIHVEPLRLEEVGGLDAENAFALLEAISIAAGYPVKLR